MYSFISSHGLIPSLATFPPPTSIPLEDFTFLPSPMIFCMILILHQPSNTPRVSGKPVDSLDLHLSLSCSTAIASIKLSDFRLLSSMNRRLFIKRSDVWSKSEGLIKLTKALSFKRGLRSPQDFCQQSRLQRHSLSFFVDMPHSQWFERGSQKFSHRKLFF